MSAADIGAIEWTSAPRADEAAACIRWLAHVDDRSAEYADSLPPACVRVVKVGGHALRFSADGDDRAATWESVLQSLAAGDAAGPAVAASTVDRLRGQLASASPEDQARAQLILQDIARRVGATPESLASANAGAEQGTQHAGIGDVLMHLNPELRSTLVQLGAMHGSQWIADHASALPIAELTSAFLSVDSSSSGPPRATVLLLSKLVGLSSLQSTLRQKLEKIASKWDIPGATGEHNAGAVSELLTDRGVRDFCPDDYRADLTLAATTAKAQVMMPIEISQLSTPVILARTAAIAEWLMRDQPCDGGDNSGPVTWVSEHIEQVPVVERFAPLNAAIESVVKVPPGDEAMGAARARVQETLRHQSVLESFLHAAGEKGELASAAGRAIVLAPEAMIEFVIERVSKERMSAEHALVRQVAREAPTASLAAIAGSAAARTDRPLGVLALLAHVGDEALLELASIAISADSPDQLRAGAFAILDRRISTWPALLIAAAFAEQSKGVPDMATRRLASRHNAADVGTLAGVLRGENAAGVPSPQVANVLIQSLLLHGPPGLAALIDILETFSRGVHRDRIRLCRRIAFELESHRGVPAVDKVLKTWRRSLGHAVGLFIVEDAGRSAA